MSAYWGQPCADVGILNLWRAAQPLEKLITLNLTKYSLLKGSVHSFTGYPLSTYWEPGIMLVLWI